MTTDGQCRHMHALDSPAQELCRRGCDCTAAQRGQEQLGSAHSGDVATALQRANDWLAGLCARKRIEQPSRLSEMIRVELNRAQFDRKKSLADFQRAPSFFSPLRTLRHSVQQPRDLLSSSARRVLAEKARAGARKPFAHTSLDARCPLNCGHQTQIVINRTAHGKVWAAACAPRATFPAFDMAGQRDRGCGIVLGYDGAESFAPTCLHRPTVATPTPYLSPPTRRRRLQHDRPPLISTPSAALGSE